MGAWGGCERFAQQLAQKLCLLQRILYVRSLNRNGISVAPSMNPSPPARAGLGAPVPSFQDRPQQLGEGPREAPAAGAGRRGGELRVHGGEEAGQGPPSLALRAWTGGPRAARVAHFRLYTHVRSDS